jgi:hypothetical protein
MDELTGSQVSDNLPEGATLSCHFSLLPFNVFDSIDELTESQVCDNLSVQFFSLAMAQRPLFLYSLTQSMSLH